MAQQILRIQQFHIHLYYSVSGKITAGHWREELHRWREELEWSYRGGGRG